MALIRQDVDTLKQASSLQDDNNSTTPDPGSVGRPSELGPWPSTPDDDDTEPVYLPPDRIPGTTWAEDPTRQNTHRSCSNDPGGASVRADQTVSRPGVLRQATPEKSSEVNTHYHRMS